ncbi:hypothetical protein FRB95_005261 [Tulasnella sp. JGI-2019a]|nr:hypothetical protein FRB93_004313 [Tulasnella sp. JGI-2019a]KAG9029494.1 hypothetical protein FRB95_005261 [Tulasnella sp. JGI-2019a]
MINAAGVYLVATLATLMLWCFYVCLYIKTVLVCRSRSISLLGFPIVIISSIFLLNLAQTTYKGFATYADGADSYFKMYDVRMIDPQWFAATDLLQSSAALAEDLLMLWRVFIVWDRNRRVVYIPAVLFVFWATSYIAIFVFDVLPTTQFDDPTFLKKYNIITMVVFANGIAEMWYSTALICYRLWSMQREKRAVAKAGSPESHVWSNITSRHKKIIRAFVQSGMLHSVTLLTFIICIGFNNFPGGAILNTLNIRIIGIATTLIILQLNTGHREVNATNQGQTADTGYSMPVFYITAADKKDHDSVADPETRDPVYNESSTDAKSQGPSFSTSAGASLV